MCSSSSVRAIASILLVFSVALNLRRPPLIHCDLAVKHFPPGEKGAGKKGSKVTWERVNVDVTNYIRLKKLAVREGSVFTGRKCQDRTERLYTLYKSDQRIYKTGEGTDESLTGKINSILEKYELLLEDLLVR